MKQLSLGEFAKYMTSSPTTQRKILHQHKYPDDEARARTRYYREAREAVVLFHRRNKGASWLLRQASTLSAAGEAESNRRRKTRLNHNARSLRDYAEHFGDLEYEVLPKLRLSLKYVDVRITISPDLHVRFKGREKIVRLEFSAAEPAIERIRIVSQALLEAANQGDYGFSAADIMYVDISRGEVHKGARMGARLRRDIESACESISAIWDRL